MNSTLKRNFTEYYGKKTTDCHLYPSHWVIRSFLGVYQKINLDKSKYSKQSILDLGFGDLRNIILLNNCGFKKISGIEITDEIVNVATQKINKLGIKADLKVGTANEIPYSDFVFDYVLASHSCYYININSSFNSNLKEIHRVIKDKGHFIVSVPSISHSIFNGCKILSGDYAVIKNDPNGLRDGSVLKFFRNKRDIVKAFSKYYYEIEVCLLQNDYWGLNCNDFIIKCRKRLN